MKKFYSKNKIANGGYMALMSAIIMSAVLLSITLTANSSGFSARFNSLSSEYKRVSLGLAESCVNVALLRIAEDYNYTVSGSGLTIPVGSDECTIKDIVYGAEDANHRKPANIKTQAVYNGAFSNIETVATVGNPTVTYTRSAVFIVTRIYNDDGGTAGAGAVTISFNLLNGGNPTPAVSTGSETGTLAFINSNILMMLLAVLFLVILKH